MPIANPADTPQRSEAEQRAFFDAALASALAAEAAAGARERFYALAGVRLRIVFAGPVMEALMGDAIAHLETPRPDAVEATFHVWDSASTGVPMAEAPCSRQCFTDRGDIWGMASERTRLAFHWSDGSVNVADMEGATYLYWVQDGTALPYWSKASPLRTLFHWLMRAHGHQLLHAAAIGTAEGAVLITGKGGVGKSTSALACLDDGMGYVGDDYLVVQLAPEPRAVSLYATAKLHAGHAENFPRFRELIANLDTMREEKAVLNLFPDHAERIALSMPLRAVLLPRISPQVETTFAPVPRAALQRAAAFTTMSQLPHAGRDTHDFIERMIAALPGLEIRLGSDLAGIPRAIRGLLADPAAAVAALAGPKEAAPRLPLVSVVIPVHDGAGFLPGAVANVLGQGYPSLEIIVVDDGSSDDIEAAVRALPVDVRFFRQIQSGPAIARNRGIKDASGELIAFLDVDDLWPDGTLPLLAEALAREPGTMVVRGHAQLFRDEPEGGMRYLGNPEESYPHYIGAALYRREAFQAVGLFDSGLMFGEDTDWARRAEEVGLPVTRLPLVTLLVRRHEANMTRGRSMLELNQLKVFHRMLGRRRALEREGAP